MPSATALQGYRKALQRFPKPARVQAQLGLRSSADELDRRAALMCRLLHALLVLACPRGEKKELTCSHHHRKVEPSLLQAGKRAACPERETSRACWMAEIGQLSHARHE